MSVVKRGNQVEAQCQTLAPVAVGAAQNMEAFEPTNDMLHVQALARQRLVFLFLLGCERMMFAFFVWRARVLMVLLNSFVATVTQATGLVLERQGAPLEQGKVMHAAGAKGSGYDAFVGLLHYHLRFGSVPLFLAAVVALLLFLGRCTGTSVASTTITSMANSLSCNTFLPGKANSPEASKAAST